MSESNPVSQRGGLLVVDDEAEVTRSLYDLFRLDYDVYTANSGPDALEILKQIPVQVVLADQRMPVMSGTQLLSRVRGMASDVVRLMMTGYADIKVVVEAINRGHVFRYIAKPWDPEELRSLVQQAFSQYNLLAERRRLIQELSTANEELRRMGALRTAFMEMAGHELRTPITYILGISDLLARLNDAKPLVEVKDKLRRMAEGSRKLGRIVDSMLKAMRSSRFPMELTLEEVHLRQLADEVADEIAPFLEQRKLTLEKNLPDLLPPVDADRGKLRDILTNLLTNAIRFTPDGGTIKLSAEALPPEHIGIRVSDTGTGIDADELPHIFEPFYGTSDVAHHSSAGGLEFGKRGPGLGLSIVKRFTDMHRGRLEVRSTPGKGSTFTVVLPVRGRRRDSSSTRLPKIS